MVNFMKKIVGVADMKVSKIPSDLLITYALGSCLGIVIYDPFARVGGMLHAMLPISSVDKEKAKTNPYMFVDTGLPKLFFDCYALGAQRERLVIKVAGGACINRTEKDDPFQIGKRNFSILTKLLWSNGLSISSYDVGGSLSRTMSLNISDGAVTLKINNQETLL